MKEHIVLRGPRVLRSTLSDPLDNQDSGCDSDDGSSNRQVEDDHWITGHWC